MPRVKKAGAAVAQGDSDVDTLNAGADQSDLEILPPVEVPFFDYLQQLEDGERERSLIYLYRLEPVVRNSDGSPRYIAKYVPPVDEERIKADHGGGKFQAILKVRGQAERKHVFYIDGEPIYQAGQVIQSPTHNPPAAAAGPAAAASSPGEMAEVVKTLAATLERIQKAPQADDQAFSAAMGTLRKAMEESLALMSLSIKQGAASPTGNPLVDKLLESAVAKLAGDTDPKAELREMLAFARELAPKPQQGTDLVSTLKALRELVADETTSAVLGIKPAASGGDDGRAPRFDWRSGLITLGQQLLQQAPNIIDRVRTMQNEAMAKQLEMMRLRMQMPGAPMPQMQPMPAPTMPAIAQPAPPMVAGARNPVPLVQIQTAGNVVQMPEPQMPPPDALQAGQVELLATLKTISAMFEAEFTGEDAAEFVIRRHPEVAAQFGPLMQDPAIVKQFAADQPIIAQHFTHPDFDEFLQEFCETITAPPDAADAAAQAPGPQPVQS